MAAKSFSMGSALQLAAKPRASYLLWVPAAALLGFAIAAFFAGVLQLPRGIYLLPYVVLVSLFLYGFVRWSHIDVLDTLLRHWVWGLILAVPLGFFTVYNILSQPSSPRTEGLQLVFDLIWLGIVYGLIDALFLSVLPVLATWKAFAALGWTTHWWGKIVVSILAIFASILVTAAYHLGYPEYRVAGGLSGPLVGNTAMSLGYLVAGNPFTAMLSHMAMHIAGVLQGPASVLQLPPHY